MDDYGRFQAGWNDGLLHRQVGDVSENLCYLFSTCLEDLPRYSIGTCSFPRVHCTEYTPHILCLKGEWGLLEAGVGCGGRWSGVAECCV